MMKRKLDVVPPHLLDRRGMIAGSGALMGAAMLGGCGVLPIAKEAPRLYTLSPKSTFPDDLPQVSFQLGIDRPTAPAALSTAKVAVMRGPYRIDYFAGSLWVDDAPNMIQRLMIESFENSGKIVGVGREAVGLRSNFVLRCELREFQAEYPGEEDGGLPVVHVAVNAKLVELPRRTIIAVSTQRARVAVPENRMTPIVETFDKALGKVLRDIVVWTLTRPETMAFKRS